MKNIRSLCMPSYIYLVISVISTVLLAFQNYNNTNTFCVGDFECNVPSTMLVFIMEGLYIWFWTYILDILCKAGNKQLSWILVLFPFILFFIIIGLIILNQTI